MKLSRTYLWISIVAALAACNEKEPDVPEQNPVPTEYTVSGKVTGSDGSALEGVVVSDGLVCTETDSEGRYYLNSTLDGVDFIFVSTPSGYSAPVEDALPVHYRKVSTLTKNGGRYTDVDFKLRKIDNPERFTLFLAGDPQPRKSTANYDKIGYHGLDCVDDMCRDFRETAAGILPDRPVYGIVLGDVCHNDASLFTTYKGRMRNNGFPTYHVIGNHDHDLSTAGDKESAAAFEDVFGPSNYSFNLGNCHFVVLDNMMVPSGKRSTNSGSDLADGLRDDIYTWLENDLKYVDTGKILMICTHSPMFMCFGETMRTRGTISFDGKKMGTHYADVDKLIKDYSKVYAWAGHTHTMYNYVNPSDQRVESHTLSRVTGELWTNEYEASGTPRGYVVLNYDHGAITWKFHPVRYQSGKHCMGEQPDYRYRDWNYEDGVARMKSDGAVLDDSYQMHVYAPGIYANDNYLYVNVFMWDELWGEPKITFNGATQKMTRCNPNDHYRSYDYGCSEIQNWYKANNSTLKSSGDYNVETRNCCTVFSAYPGQSQAAGRNKASVSVKDRFGNTYTSTISW